MAKGPPAKYDPGELDATRRRLGSLSPEEARRMADLLGGEVGVEKTDSGLQERYNRMRSDSLKNKAYHAGRSSGHTPPLKKTTTGPAVNRRPATDQKPKQALSELVKINYKAASIDHKLIRGGRFIQTLFRYIFRVPDRVNPQFIRHLRSEYIEPLEQLTATARQYLQEIDKSPLKQQLHPFYRQILEVIQDFEIREIRNETARLQKRANDVRFESCKPLVKMLYRPLVQLGNLDPVRHIQQGLGKSYSLSVKRLPENSPGAEIAYQRFDAAADAVDRIFNQLKHRLYPMLMKLISSRFHEFQPFFQEERFLIMSFLYLTPQEIVQVPAVNPDIAPEMEALEEKDEDQEAEESGEAAEEDAATVRRSDGIALLETMFPESGWDTTDANPDLYPYFEPLLRLPADTVLIPRSDILQRIVVLLGVLQELLYGFRAIKFGFTRNRDSEPVELKERLEELTGRWHYFIDELIGKAYLSKLIDYTRQFERNPDFPRSQYGLKMQAELSWIRRKYLFPHTPAQKLYGGAPAVSSRSPKLQEWVPRLIEVLDLVCEEMIAAPGGMLESIRNAWDPMQFEIEHPVTKRFRQVLHRQDRKCDNSNLIISVLALLELLNHYLNDENSPAYQNPPQSLFRSENDDGRMPLYSVPLKNPLDIMQTYDAAKQRHEQETPPSENSGEAEETAAPVPEEAPITWPTGSIQGEKSLKHNLAGIIQWHRAGPCACSFIVLVPAGLGRLSAEEKPLVLGRIGTILKKCLDAEKDTAFLIKERFFVLVLTGREKNAAADAAALLRRTAEAEKLSGIIPYQAVLGYKAEWDVDETLQNITRAVRRIMEKVQASGAESSPE